MGLDMPHLYKQILEFSRRLLAEKDINRLLSVAMDMAIEITGAERGWLIVFNEETKEIEFQAARNLQKKDIEKPDFEISRTIIYKVKAEGKPVCLQNALDDKLFKESRSLIALKVLSVICLPMVHNDESFGVVYLDSRKLTGVFKPEVFSFVQEFTSFISSAAFNALERNHFQNQVSDLEKELRCKYSFDSIIGQHPKILETLQIITQVADTDATVLIQGESGTGKELIARALHYNSSRRDKPFIAVNCAALPEELLESELFGHVKGAFTGATKDRAGWFEKASGSTIFLDEINDMSSALQAKLLRVLQSGDYSRVGSSEIEHCDVRVLAASSKNMRVMIEKGHFREELFYRLNVIDIWLPPLRERKSDIPLLVQHFLDVYKKKYQKPGITLSPQTETILMNYDFPGNIREIENMIQRVVILVQGNTIDPQHLPASILQKGNQIKDTKDLLPLMEIKHRESNRAEKNAIINYLQATSGHITKAAAMAGLDVSNFHKLIKKHNIDPKTFSKV